MNNEAAVTICFGLPAFIKKRIGLKNIPPPIPTTPEIKPNIPPISNLKQTYLQIQELVEILSNHIDEEAPKIFPAMIELLDSQLAVRLVSCAGSLAKLARLPSSTIQLLGAEKALFRHMSDGSLPPKQKIL